MADEIIERTDRQCRKLMFGLGVEYVIDLARASLIILKEDSTVLRVLINIATGSYTTEVRGVRHVWARTVNYVHMRYSRFFALWWRSTLYNFSALEHPNYLYSTTVAVVKDAYPPHMRAVGVPQWNVML